MTPFHFFNVLTRDGCEQNLSVLDQLSDHWTPRREGMPFHTLGTPSYLDGSEPKNLSSASTAAAMDFVVPVLGASRTLSPLSSCAPSAPCPSSASATVKTSSKDLYNQRVLEMNALLRQNFSGLLSNVRECIEHHLQSKLHDLPGASLPGFHIFGSHPLFIMPIASIHFDLQYEMVTWPELPDLESVISFTLPLMLPKDGGGLNWWDIDFDVYQTLDTEQKSVTQRDNNKQYLPYEQGKLVLHSGHLLHQIAPASATMLPSDRRVTLQGHAARAGGVYYWYW